jgi:hypothetical protein
MDLPSNVIPLKPGAIDYAVFEERVHNHDRLTFEVWLVRGREKAVRVFGSFYSDIAQSHALKYRLVRSVALGMGYRP